MDVGKRLTGLQDVDEEMANYLCTGLLWCTHLKDCLFVADEAQVALPWLSSQITHVSSFYGDFVIRVADAIVKPHFNLEWMSITNSLVYGQQGRHTTEKHTFFNQLMKNSQTNMHFYNFSSTEQLTSIWDITMGTSHACSNSL